MPLLGNGITGNRDDITDVQENVVDVQSEIENVEKIGSVWFDAWRITFADAGTFPFVLLTRVQ